MPLEKTEEYIERAKERVKKSKNIHPDNKQAILDFVRYMELKDYSNHRIYKYLNKLPSMAEKINKPFLKATQADIEKFIMWLKHRPDITDTTKLDYKILLKRFYKWLGNGKYPPSVEFITTTEKNNKKKLPKDMLTQKDISKLIQAANNPRDMAFIAMLWETGARIGELLDLTVGDLEDHKHGLKVVVEGKTGSRRLILVESVKYVNLWLRAHPKREKESPLWTNLNNAQPVGYRAINKMLNVAAAEAKIKKPVNPHNFRHSRATYMANFFTEAQMCEWFGWVQGSDVPARYVHLSGRDIDNAYVRMLGLNGDTEEEQKEEEIAYIQCPRCNFEGNPSTASFCSNCGMALGMEAAMEADQLGQELVEALKKPEVAQAVIAALEAAKDNQ